MSAHALPALPRLSTQPRFATEGLAIGADIGGTHQTVAVARLDGEVLALHRRRLRDGGTAQDVVANVFALTDEALVSARHSARRPGSDKLLRIGVGFGGPVDQKRGLVLTSHHVPGWNEYPLRDVLEQRLDVPAVVDNDANAAALGEASFGAGRGQRHLLYVNVGTGIGAGIILNGVLYHGKSGLAGEIGHVTVEPSGPQCGCGKRGCLEALASGRSIGRRGREAVARDHAAAAMLVQLAGGNASAIESAHVLQAAMAGDPLAQRVVETTACYLGLAFANAANLLDPEMIIVGGGLSESGEVLFAPLRAAVHQHLLPGTAPPLVVPAALGYNAGIAGALALALDGL